MATWTQKFSSEWATLTLVVTENSQDIQNNQTKLKCVMKITKDKTCSAKTTSGSTIYMEINGTKQYTATSFDISSLAVGSTKTLATKYVTVTHGSTGMKSVSCKAYFKAGTTSKMGYASISQTFTCTQIPQIPKFTHINTVDIYIGSTVNYTTTPICVYTTETNRGVYNTGIEVRYNNEIVWSKTSNYKIDISNNYLSTSNRLGQILADTDVCDAELRTCLVISSQESSQKYYCADGIKQVRLHVPDYVRPEVKTITCTPETKIINGIEYNDTVISGVTGCAFQVSGGQYTGESGEYSYPTSALNVTEVMLGVGTLYRENQSVTLDSNGSFTNTFNYTANKFTSVSGNLKVNAKARDVRSRNSNTKSGEVYVTQYFKPSFMTGFTASRVGDNKSIQCQGTIKYTSIIKDESDINKVTLTLRAVPQLDGGVVGETIVNTYDLTSDNNNEIEFSKTFTVTDENTVYKVYAEVHDAVTINQTSTSPEIIVKGVFKAFSVSNDGMNMALGKIANPKYDGQTERKLESLYEIKAPKVTTTSGADLDAIGAYCCLYGNGTGASDAIQLKATSQNILAGKCDVTNYKSDIYTTNTTNGTITVKEKGLYMVIMQAFLYDGYTAGDHVVVKYTINSTDVAKQTMRFTIDNPSPYTTMSSTDVVYLQENDVLALSAYNDSDARGTIQRYSNTRLQLVKFI